jgi:hypothetical protein
MHFDLSFSDESEDLERDQKIEILQDRIGEIRKIYMQLKAEVALIDRRRKRARRKEREGKHGKEGNKMISFLGVQGFHQKKICGRGLKTKTLLKVEITPLMSFKHLKMLNSASKWHLNLLNFQNQKMSKKTS